MLLGEEDRVDVALGQVFWSRAHSMLLLLTAARMELKIQV